MTLRAHMCTILTGTWAMKTTLFCRNALPCPLEVELSSEVVKVNSVVTRVGAESSSPSTARRMMMTTVPMGERGATRSPHAGHGKTSSAGAARRMPDRETAFATAAVISPVQCCAGRSPSHRPSPASLLSWSLPMVTLVEPSPPHHLPWPVPRPSEEQVM
ncbi:hypothetical protein E2562_013155 [Oryza meyeriana var. granulata]|uniref:Uncharacterized protein n=1 Tax=Oryza meyeriana var. granulata TaxID=110450 RepID=A0A6G1F7Y3_9ORYZ|nr:hypothetical protein E2562_013155 [Oryza meyeriana var. granulata]